MLKEGPTKSRVTKRYAGKEQKEKCNNAVKASARKRDQRTRDKLLGDRRLFAEYAAVNQATTFVNFVAGRFALRPGWEERPSVSIGGFGDDPRDWDIIISTPEDREIEKLCSRRPMSKEVISKIKDLTIRSEATRRRFGFAGGRVMKIRDLLKD